jgi:hypothetical protein
MTYARARLWLGISGVGIMVVLSIITLWSKWPHRIFDGFEQNLVYDAIGLVWIVALYAAIHIPLDYIGGYWLPCHFSRQCLVFSYFASQYIRGLLTQSLFLIVSGIILLQVGRAGGRIAVLCLLGALMLLMIELQDRMAALVAGLELSGEESRAGRRVLLFSGMDSGFSGGLAGLPGRERMVVPALWRRILPQSALEATLERRYAALATGARLRGLLVAMGWNLTGFYLSSTLPAAGVSTLAELFTTALYFTLWSFVGLLLLPTLSRFGVYELDQFARRHGMSENEFVRTVRELDQLQDDEPKRPMGVEAIFHPVPSVESRIERFRDDWRGPGAWNAARYALFLSWPCLGFLNRAVHCNSGRPELWVMLPVD